jgi:hypothetical protein
MEEGQTPNDLKREQSEPGVAQNGLDVADKDGALDGDSATPLEQGENDVSPALENCETDPFGRSPNISAGWAYIKRRHTCERYNE